MVALPVIANHTTSWHDGGVAILLPNGDVMALAAERVGDRYKHSWDSKLAYDYLQTRLPSGYFGGVNDKFIDTRNGLETDNHHYYHATSTYFASGIEEAAVLVVDGQGPAGEHLSTTTIWDAAKGKVSLVEDISPCPPPFASTSVGHFYTAIGALAGFKGLFCEGKVMALAAYGHPSTMLDVISSYVEVSLDGLPTIDPTFTLSVLGHTLGPDLYGWPAPTDDYIDTWELLNALRRDPRPRWPTQDDMNIAYAGQYLLERVLIGLARRARALTGRKNLCIAGGVGLNCVANEKIRQEGLFEQVYVVPAPADDGQALGKLYAILAQQGIDRPALTSPYLGPEYNNHEVYAALSSRHDLVIWRMFNETAELIQSVASLLSNDSVIGWFQGRSELGPRALGHRSILADPRNPLMRDRLNQVKGREWFRPFAPVIKLEAVPGYFQTNSPSPYMSFAVNGRSATRSSIAAAVHVDGTARVQTVEEKQEPRLYRLLSEFEVCTGVPVLINTSFNGREQPIVETPEDAISAFVSLRLDALVIGNYIVRMRDI